MVKNKNIQAVFDQLGSNIALQIGISYDQIRFEVEYFFKIGIDEIGHFWFFFSGFGRASGKSADSYQSMFLSYFIQDFSSFFGQTDDSLGKFCFEHGDNLTRISELERRIIS